MEKGDDRTKHMASARRNGGGWCESRRFLSLEINESTNGEKVRFEGEEESEVKIFIPIRICKSLKM